MTGTCPTAPPDPSRAPPASGPPMRRPTRGWALAGGLGPDSVAAAAALARPDLVDVSSGVAGPDGVRKDPGLVAAFVRNARAAAPPA